LSFKLQCPTTTTTTAFFLRLPHLSGVFECLHRWKKETCLHVNHATCLDPTSNVSLTFSNSTLLVALVLSGLFRLGSNHFLSLSYEGPSITSKNRHVSSLLGLSRLYIHALVRRFEITHNHQTQSFSKTRENVHRELQS